MIGLVTAQARAAVEKARRKQMEEQGTPGHDSAQAAEDFHDDDDQDPITDDTDDDTDNDTDDSDDEVAAKAAFPEGSSRPYLTPGHAADSPSNVPGGHSAAVPQTGQRTGYGPITESLTSYGIPRTQVYRPEAPAPRPQTSLGTSQTPAPAGPAYQPGTATVAHLDLTGQPGPSAAPTQPAFHTAPTGAIAPQPRGGGNAAPMPPGA